MSEPLLVVEGTGKQTSTRSGLIGQWFAITAGIGYLVFYALSITNALGASPGPLVLMPLIGGPPLLATASVLWSLWRGRRSGRVEFYEDEIRVTRFGARSSHPWSDFVGFRDEASDAVELVRAGLKASVFVPTPDEQARVQVLALLDGRGLARHER